MSRYAILVVDTDELIACTLADDPRYRGNVIDVNKIKGDVLGKYIICEELGR